MPRSANHSFLSLFLSYLIENVLLKMNYKKTVFYTSSRCCRPPPPTQMLSSCGLACSTLFMLLRWGVFCSLLSDQDQTAHCCVYQDCVLTAGVPQWGGGHLSSAHRSKGKWSRLGPVTGSCVWMISTLTPVTPLIRAKGSQQTAASLSALSLCSQERLICRDVVIPLVSF